MLAATEHHTKDEALLPYRGTSLIRNTPPPQGHRRALGIFLL